MNREKIAASVIVLLNVIIFLILLFTQKYSPILVYLNIISILVVWVWVFNPKKALIFLKEKKTDVFISIILFALSLAVLVYKVDTIKPGIYGDETAAGLHGIELLKSKEMPPYIAAHSQPLAHGYLTAWSVALFGNNLFALRFPSIVAGALSAIALFALLRLFIKRKIALITALIFVFSYQSLIIWRQSYEIGESVLFQIIALIFLCLLFKKKDIRSLVGFGLATGISLHFYITTRTIAFFMAILSLISFRGFSSKKMLKYFVILFISLFISTAILSSYTAVHWNEFWQRVSTLSVFGRNLPVKDVIGEIFGSIRNDMGLFIFSGDPNPRYNPVGVPLYDPISSILIISGLIYLFLKQRKLLYVFIFLSIPVVINDIFAMEIFPEFHKYGTGHPNSMRISGFIPLFYLLIGLALANLESLLKRISREFSNVALIFICSLVIIYNFCIYFGQQSINPIFFSYNYRYGNAYVLDVNNYLNKRALNEVYVSKNITYFTFFLNKPGILRPIDEKNVQQTLHLILTSKVVIIDPSEDEKFVNELMEKVQERSIPFIQLNTPFGPYGAIIFNPQ
jgi:4-amino-4-deoxy-L-arabinose transferase-like glycosyltransferase